MASILGGPRASCSALAEELRGWKHVFGCALVVECLDDPTIVPVHAWLQLTRQTGLHEVDLNMVSEVFLLLLACCFSLLEQPSQPFNFS